MTLETTFNRAAYDLWSSGYDTYPNSTVAIDDFSFPDVYSGVAGVRVLEIGCGTGRHTVRLAAQGNRVVAVDISPGMLSVARAKLARSDAVQFLEADFLSEDCGSAFDAALAALVLEHVSDLALFFSKVAVALRPGGHFFLSEIHPDRIAGGSQANFTDKDGRHVRLVSFAHTDEAIQSAAQRAGLVCLKAQDVLGDERLVGLNPDWARYLGRPMLRIWDFERSA